MDYGEPVSYLAVEEGTPVVSADGDEVGKVEHVLGDEDTDIFDGIVIDTMLGPGGLRFVDAPQVQECYVRAVVISVPAADLDSLPEPSANPAVVEHHGVEDTESPLAAKLRRAWDLISGNT